MLDKRTERHLVKIVRDSFINQDEKSGGMGYRYYHSMRVYNYCKQFLRLNSVKKLGVDSDVVLITGMFHDIGRAKDKRKTTTSIMEEHDEIGAKMVKTLLKKHVDKGTIDRVSEILDNYKNDNYFSWEKELVSYADELDHIGALDIWRMFVFEGYHKGSLDDKIAYWKKFESKRFDRKWINKFRLKDIRRIANRRVTVLRRFMDEIESENKAMDIARS